MLASRGDPIHRNVVRPANGTVVCPRVRVATSWWPRLRGLLARPPLASGEGFWLAPCNSIHTVGMTYAIDVVFMDDADRIVAVAAEVAPLRFRWGPRGSCAALELPPGEAHRLELVIGERITLGRQAEMTDGR